MSLATIGAVVGIGAGVNSLTGGSLFGGGSGTQGGSGNTSQYIPTGLGSADQTWQQMLQQLQGGSSAAGGAINPQLQQAFQQLMGVDPSGMLNSAQQQGAYTGNLAANEDAMHNVLSGQAGVNQQAQQSLMGAGNQLYQTSLDPNNALRNSLQQQVTDASRAGTSARGIGMSGNAAGIENNDVSNFLQQWQQQQLQNQATGLQGMTSAYGQAGQQGQNVGTNLTGAAQLGTMAAGNIGSAGSIPYASQLSAYGQPFANANMYSGSQGGVNNLYSGIQSQIIPYLNYGSGATNNAFGQQQTGLNNLTSGLGQLSSAFGGSTSSPLSAWGQLQDQFQYPGGQGNYNTGGYSGSQFSDGTAFPN